MCFGVNVGGVNVNVSVGVNAGGINVVGCVCVGGVCGGVNVDVGPGVAVGGQCWCSLLVLVLFGCLVLFVCLFVRSFGGRVGWLVG